MLLCNILTNLFVFLTTTPPLNFLIHNTNQPTKQHTEYLSNKHINTYTQQHMHQEMNDVASAEKKTFML